MAENQQRWNSRTASWEDMIQSPTARPAAAAVSAAITVKAPVGVSNIQPLHTEGGWMSLIREPHGGAWQAGITLDAPRQILSCSAVFACIVMIAEDIAKLRMKLIWEDEDGICEEIRYGSPFLPVLRKPNDYQNRIRFWEQWLLSKLLMGNTYVLKQRDSRGIVTRLYVLDPRRVKILITESGDIWYELDSDNLSGIDERVAVPASEIIHDMCPGFFHPMCGTSPIYACAMSATQSNKIQVNSTKFFDNMSRPSGMLTSDHEISDEVAGRLKQHWEQNYTGSNIGKLAVLGDGLKYEAMTIPAQEAQLIEQQKWTTQDIARCFRCPEFKLGGPIPAGATVEVLQRIYYNDCLQIHIESAEVCMDEGLALPSYYYTEFDLDGLLRMDTAARYDSYGKGIGGGWMHPNFARAKENMKPIAGGDTAYMQEQNYSLEALSKRDAMENPWGARSTPANPSATPPKLPAPPNNDDEVDEDETVDQAAALLDVFRRELADEVI